jgi:hypothetical protein
MLGAILPLDELKEILKLIVADLERSAAAKNTLRSGSTERLAALELALQTNIRFSSHTN